MYSLAQRLRLNHKKRNNSYQNRSEESGEHPTTEDYVISFLKQLLIGSFLQDYEILTIFQSNANDTSHDHLQILKNNHMANLSYCDDFNYLFFRILSDLAINSSGFLQTLSKQREEVKVEWVHALLQGYCSFLSGKVSLPPYILWNRIKVQQRIKTIVYTFLETILSSSHISTDRFVTLSTTTTACDELSATISWVSRLPTSLRSELQELDDELYKLLSCE
jgi:hypothetical protein